MFKNLMISGLLASSLILSSCDDYKSSGQKKDEKSKQEDEERSVSKEFRHKLITKKGNKIFKDVFADRNKVILVWGARWHPVSKKFLPAFSKKYKALKGLGYEVVYISGERSYKDFVKYVKQMPWPILDYKFRDKVRVVSENNPADIPYIAIVNKECVAIQVGSGDSVMRALKLEHPELN